MAKSDRSEKQRCVRILKKKNSFWVEDVQE